MNQGWKRQLARFLLWLLQAMLPAQLKSWGRAIHNELDEIGNDRSALLFALDSFRGLFPRAMLDHGRNLASFSWVKAPSGTGLLFRPEHAGILCATSAVLLGCVYLFWAGAPILYVATNFAALVLGVTIFAFSRWHRLHRPGFASKLLPFGSAALLLSTALWGVDAAGAARWIKLGPMALQPSLLVLPMMIVLFARSRSKVWTVAIIIAAVALALQPDRAMSGVLLASIIAIATICRGNAVRLALVASVVSFIATLVQSDNLPATAFVDQILYSSFDVNIVAGMAVVTGSLLILVPAIIGWLRDPDHRPMHIAFAAAWAASVIAAVLGNYPTPIVGYGGSAIIGYLLSLASLPGTGAAALRSGLRRYLSPDPQPADRNMQTQWPVTA